MMWYEENKNDIAISTRVRLARNITGIQFPSHLHKDKIRETNIMIKDAVLSANLSVDLRAIDMETLGEIEAYAMVERHIISPKFAANREGRILLLSDDESVSIMIGEEDHLRIQVLKCGACLNEAYRICDEIDNAISQKLNFAFDDKLGFLTECPTNLGTGLRASIMLHLPLLEKTGELRSIADATNKIGLTFRGFYGEGSDSKASIYQLSNQITLGVSELDAIDNLNKIAEQIIFKENECVTKLDNKLFEDSVYRSLGILKYARRLSTDEMMSHITKLMLGCRAGILKLDNLSILMSVFINTQPAMIKRIKGDIDANERDYFRAEFIREKLNNIN